MEKQMRSRLLIGEALLPTFAAQNAAKVGHPGFAD
jgi:hypothetical protein